MMDEHALVLHVPIPFDPTASQQRLTCRFFGRPPVILLIFDATPWRSGVEASPPASSG
jgi:hypothetical protein